MPFTQSHQSHERDTVLDLLIRLWERHSFQGRNTLKWGTLDHFFNWLFSMRCLKHRINDVSSWQTTNRMKGLDEEVLMMCLSRLVSLWGSRSSFPLSARTRAKGFKRHWLIVVEISYHVSLTPETRKAHEGLSWAGNCQGEWQWMKDLETLINDFNCHYHCHATYHCNERHKTKGAEFVCCFRGNFHERKHAHKIFLWFKVSPLEFLETHKNS